MFDDLLGPGQDRPAVVGGADAARPSVLGVDPTSDQVGGLEVVEQVGHDAAVDEQTVGQTGLGGRLALGRAGEHVVAAAAVWKVGEGLFDVLVPAAEQNGQGPPQVVLRGPVRGGGVHLLTVSRAIRASDRL